MRLLRKYITQADYFVHKDKRYEDATVYICKIIMCYLLSTPTRITFCNGLFTYVREYSCDSFVFTKKQIDGNCVALHHIINEASLVYNRRDIYVKYSDGVVSYRKL